jgi:glutamate-1-semialdehyde 2,1-aminomutase
MEGFQAAANKAGIALQVGAIGSMFGFFFNDKPVKNFADALNSDTKRFALFHQGMLERRF